MSQFFETGNNILKFTIWTKTNKNTLIVKECHVLLPAQENFADTKGVI